MAGVATVNALLPLVEKYQPRCVAMCGVCAGPPGKTNLGDVIAPERLFFHDTGKKLEAMVMKGVMDFANQGRDDHFKQFAARVSAEYLTAFLL